MTEFETICLIQKTRIKRKDIIDNIPNNNPYKRDMISMEKCLFEWEERFIVSCMVSKSIIHATP